MLVGLWKLIWIEIKIFLREPLGAIGTIVVPVVVFLVLGRIFGRGRAPAAPSPNSFVHVGLPVLASLLIAVSAVLSLVTLISIYREGGILTRLRATPRYPAAPVHDSSRPRAGQAATHGSHTGLDGSRRQTLLSGWRSCALVFLHRCAADQHLQHPVHR